MMNETTPRTVHLRPSRLPGNVVTVPQAATDFNRQFGRLGAENDTPPMKEIGKRGKRTG